MTTLFEDLPENYKEIIEGKTSLKEKPTFIDMFCGCGGLSQGFVDAGYEALFGVDYDEPSLKSYSENFGEAKGVKIDLFDNHFLDKFESLVAKSDKGKIDVVVAGPPCQGFSLTGSRNFEDPRNQLYLSVFKVVEKFKPEAFLIENVKGMKTLYKGEVVADIVRRFTDLGYNVCTPTILSSADYGVPQVRERLFFVGLKKELGIYEFPEKTHNEATYLTCHEAIGNLPSREEEFGKEVDSYSIEPQTAYQKFMQANSNILRNHVASKHTDYVKSVIKLVPEGKNYKSLPVGIGESRKFNEAWTRYHSQKPSRTIDTGHRNHFHYKWHRVPTVRENSRLQSFRDDFIFCGTKTQQYKQVGNAVPPLLAYYLAKKLLSYLKK